MPEILHPEDSQETTPEPESRWEKELQPDFRAALAEMKEKIKTAGKLEDFDKIKELLPFLLFEDAELWRTLVREEKIVMTDALIIRMLDFIQNPAQESSYSPLGASLRINFSSPFYDKEEGGQGTFIPRQRMTDSLNEYRDKRSPSFLLHLKSPLAPDLYELSPPTDEQIFMWKQMYPHLLVEVLRNPHLQELFDRTFPDSVAAQEWRDKHITYFPEVFSGPFSQRMYERAFPTNAEADRWAEGNPDSFLGLMGKPVAPMLLEAITTIRGKEGLKNLVSHAAREHPIKFLSIMDAPLADRVWQLAESTTEDAKHWFNELPGSFTEAIRSPMRERIFALTDLTEEDMAFWKEKNPFYTVRMMQTPFGEKIFDLAFPTHMPDGEDRWSALRSWMHQHVQAFLQAFGDNGLAPELAEKILASARLTTGDAQWWFKGEYSSLLGAIEGPYGRNFFDLMPPDSQKFLKEMNPQSFTTLGINNELHGKESSFAEATGLLGQLERPPSSEEISERTIGIEIEPFNNEKNEIKSHAFPSGRRTELAQFFRSYLAATQTFEKKKDMPHGFTNTHVSFALRKKDQDRIATHKDFFIHDLPQAFLYAYFPVERIVYRGIDKMLNTAIDVDVERDIDPETTARLQYRLGAIGGATKKESELSLQGMDDLIGTTMRLLDSDEARNRYEKLIISSEFQDILIETHWLIFNRYRSARAHLESAGERDVHLNHQIKETEQKLGALVTDGAPLKGVTPEQRADEVAKINETATIQRERLRDQLRLSRRNYAEHKEDMSDRTSQMRYWKRLINDRQEMLRKLLEQ